jgi:hypothetical protein
MPDDLYHSDALAWAEQQADLLERLARGERVNEHVDWSNVAQEVRDVGLSELRAVRSLLTRAMEQLLKLHAWPASRDANHWRVETLHFLLEAGAECSPSMRARIDVQDIYRRALVPHGQLRMGGQPAQLYAPAQCPFDLDDLLVAKECVPDIDALLGRLAAGM